jgi:uncharacterized protein (DUF302 family)
MLSGRISWPPLAACVWLLIAPLALASDQPVLLPSNHDVDATLDRLEELAEQQGMQVHARIDQRAEAAALNRRLRPAQLLILADPASGVRILQTDPRAGLDLALRVWAFEDDQGDTWVSYRDPQGMRAGLHLGPCPSLDRMAGRLQRLVEQASQ